eukprot:TRINITY_DN4498_c0_g1_i4.p1 TRINITY_DN4498_c0_g1~~TRINITY_DN4498_c0_g1_i4.p1  ORF type:complete len:199 (-),score=44.43 TRINITY_DN4498_c0_g1_i4:128-724(-)
MVSLRCVWKTILATAGGLVAILAAILIYFTYAYLSNDAISKAFGQNMATLRNFMYVVAGTLIAFGGLALLSAKFENKCLICLFEIVAFVIFLFFLSIFIAICVIETIGKKAFKEAFDNKDIEGMYQQLEQNTEKIFVKEEYCYGVSTLFECSKEDLEKRVLMKYYKAELMGYGLVLEVFAKCSGMNDHKLEKYFFSGS